MAHFHKQGNGPSCISGLLEKGFFGKGVFWKRGLFRKVCFLEILENLEILEILENSQTVDHFLEIQENLEILEIPPVKKTPFVMTPSSGPEY